MPIEIITLEIKLTAANFNLDDIIVESKKFTGILAPDYYWANFLGKKSIETPQYGFLSKDV